MVVCPSTMHAWSIFYCHVISAFQNARIQSYAGKADTQRQKRIEVMERRRFSYIGQYYWIVNWNIHCGCSVFYLLLNGAWFRRHPPNCRPAVVIVWWFSGKGGWIKQSLSPIPVSHSDPTLWATLTPSQWATLIYWSGLMESPSISCWSFQLIYIPCSQPLQTGVPVKFGCH